VTFTWEGNPRWAATTLRTVTRDNKNLQQLSLDVDLGSYGSDVDSNEPDVILYDIGEACYQGWLELDSVLAQLWESHSIRTQIEYEVPASWTDGGAGRRMQKLLPETTSRGIVDLKQIDEWRT
jgi:hypothetical protein